MCSSSSGLTAYMQPPQQQKQPPQQQQQQGSAEGGDRKRKAEWPLEQDASSQKPPYQQPKQQTLEASALKEIADQFTTSQIELAAQSAMQQSTTSTRSLSNLATGMNSPGFAVNGNGVNNGSGASQRQRNEAEFQTIQQQQMQQQPVFAPKQQAVAAPQPQLPALAGYSSPYNDVSWANLDPTPIREGAVSTSSHSNPNNGSDGNSDSSAKTRDILSTLKTREQQVPPKPYNINVHQVLKQFMSVTPVSHEPSVLHRSMKFFSQDVNVIKGAIEFAPHDLRRKAQLRDEDDDDNDSKCSKGRKGMFGGIKTIDISKGSCGYPLNIALQHNASMEVLELLVQAAPEVITCRDGPDESGSLHIVLRREPANTPQLLHMLIKANPLSLRMTDRRRNTPLHVAAGRGASLQVVRALYLLYPKAIVLRNLSGETPLEIAQRSTTLCGEEVLNFVQKSYYEELLKAKDNSS